MKDKTKIPNLIGISGRMGSGKDTVGTIIQALTGTGFGDDKAFETFKKTGLMPISTNKSPFVIKKFAGKLKDIVCLLIGCTREQLEDADFKQTELGKEWIKWGIVRENGRRIIDIKATEKEAKGRLPIWGEDAEVVPIKLTPRLILQLLGTDCGRDIIHPNIWVNALFADYKENYIGDWGQGHHMYSYPSWIITDVRFPNELEALKARNGLSIRVNTNRAGILSNHESETALDDATFDYVIDNSGTIEELINKVRDILETERIIG